MTQHICDKNCETYYCSILWEQKDIKLGDPIDESSKKSYGKPHTNGGFYLK